MMYFSILLIIDFGPFNAFFWMNSQEWDTIETVVFSAALHAAFRDDNSVFDILTKLRDEARSISDIFIASGYLE